MFSRSVKGFTLAETIVAMVIALMLVFLIFESIYFFTTRVEGKLTENRAAEELFLLKGDIERLFSDSPEVVQQGNALQFFGRDTLRVTYTLEKGERVIRSVGQGADTLGITVEECRTAGVQQQQKIAVDSVALTLRVGNMRVALNLHRNPYRTTLFSRSAQPMQ